MPGTAVPGMETLTFPTYSSRSSVCQRADSGCGIPFVQQYLACSNVVPETSTRTAHLRCMRIRLLFSCFESGVAHQVHDNPKEIMVNGTACLV